MNTRRLTSESVSANCANLREARAGSLQPSCFGFTLIEVLLALAICAIVLVAINAVFATAVRLRDKTSNTLNDSLPINQAMDILRRDLKDAVGPGGYLAGDFKCDATGMGANMGMSGGAGVNGLDFFTSTGLMSDDAPWGDLQEVYYELKAPDDRRQPGMDLVRCVNRNLLATTTQTPDFQWLMGNVQSIEFDCFDGAQWQTSWDTSMGNTNLPNAVRILIQLVPNDNGSAARPQPIEMVIPLVCQTMTIRTNS